MSLPQPVVSLEGACSVIHDNTLYEFSAAGFQSLALEEGAEWKALANGTAVEGGVCIGSTPKDPADAAMFVVGGSSKDPEYNGLQKFTYSTGKWTSIKPQVSVTQNRKWHSAIFLNESNSIFVYAGGQDGVQFPSTQTFTIGAAEPYPVLAFQSIAPPAVAPLLLPWSANQAAMVGGDPTNTKVMLFDPKTGWADSGATLAEPLPKDTTLLKGTLVRGDDDSKHLYTFDLTTSPNTVSRTMLRDANGPVVKAAPVQAKKPSAEKGVARRDGLTAADWPQYNGTLAPTTTRTQYSLASTNDGLVVMSGGNDQEPLSMFDVNKNSWENATAMLVGNDVGVESLSSPDNSPTSFASASATPVASATSSPTVAAAAPVADKPASPMSASTILGITLGIVFGIALLLIVLLFLIRSRRRHQTHSEQGHQRRASGVPEKHDYPPDITVAKASGDYYRSHVPKGSRGSISSMAILMGKAQKPAMQRTLSKSSEHSMRSSASSYCDKHFNNLHGRPSEVPTVQAGEFAEQDAPRDEKAVSFAAETHEPKARSGPTLAPDGSTRRSSGWNRYFSGGSTLNVFGFGANGRRETQASEQSVYSTDMNRMTQDSATVPPLQMDGRPSFNRVNTGSPTVQQTSHMEDGLSGQIERPVSAASSSGYSSGIPASVRDTWDPATATEDDKPWGHARAPSSVYATALNPPAASRPPTGVSKQPQLAEASTSDMSWLNLGDNNRI